MKQDIKTYFCFFSNIICFGLVLLVMLATDLNLQDVKQEVEARQNSTAFQVEQMEKIIDKQKAIIEEQNKNIELYKLECENTARCIIEGEW